MRLIQKNIPAILFVLLVLTTGWSSVLAQSDSGEPEVVISFFWREGCSHCTEEKPFLLELADQNPQIVLNAYEVYTNIDNREYMYLLGVAMGFEAGGVPVTVIGDQSWIGYNDVIGDEIEEAVAACQESGCPDPAEAFNVDKSATAVSLEFDEEDQSSSPVWIIAAVLFVLLAYVAGRFKARQKPEKKKLRKRH